MKIFNNLKTDMEDVVIIGRIPYIGNIDANENNLNTSIDTYLNGEVISNGLISKIYYTEELNADKDSDTWNENVSDYKNIKAFKIVLENNVIHQGENIEFSYNFVIPEGLTYNQVANGCNIIYYKANEENRVDNTIFGVETEKREISILDCKEIEIIEKADTEVEEPVIPEVEEPVEENVIPEIPEETVKKEVLHVGTNVTRGGITVEEGEKVNERQVLKYTAFIKNISDEQINNVVIKGRAHNANLFYWNTFQTHSTTTDEIVTTGEFVEDKDGSYGYETMKIGTLLPGDEVKFEYQVVVNGLENLDSQDGLVYGQIFISADEIEEKEIQTLKCDIRDTDLELALYEAGLEDEQYRYVLSEGEYYVKAYLKNISNEIMKNVDVNFMLSENLNYNSMTQYMHLDYNIRLCDTSTGTMVTVTLDELKPGEEKYVYLYTTTDKVDISLAEEKIHVYCNANVNGNLYLSNDFTRTVDQTETDYEIQYYTNIPEGTAVNDGDNVIYTYIAKNVGAIEETTIIGDYLPDGLNVNSIKLYREDGSVENIELDEYEEYFEEEEVIDDGEELTEEELQEVLEMEEYYSQNPIEFEGDEEVDNEFIDDYVDEEIFNIFTHEITIRPNETIKVEVDTTVNMDTLSGEDLVNSIELSTIPEEKNKEITLKVNYPEDWNVDEDIETDDTYIDVELEEFLQDAESLPISLDKIKLDGALKINVYGTIKVDINNDGILDSSDEVIKNQEVILFNLDTRKIY